MRACGALMGPAAGASSECRVCQGSAAQLLVRLRSRVTRTARAEARVFEPGSAETRRGDLCGAGRPFLGKQRRRRAGIRVPGVCGSRCHGRAGPRPDALRAAGPAAGGRGGRATRVRDTRQRARESGELGITASILALSGQSPSGAAGGTSDGYGLGRGAAGPDRRITTAAAGALRVVVDPSECPVILRHWYR